MAEPEEDPRKAEISERVESLISQRSEARQAQDWQKADSIRDELANMGVVVTDTLEGPIWDLI